MNGSTALRLALLLSLFCADACGRKAAPRPPEDAAPRAVAELAASNVREGIRLTWERPREYVDRTRLRDLGSFELWRIDGEGAGKASKIDTVTVDDRERFQQAKRFVRVDNNVVSGKVYQYYVIVFTVDGYSSEPSNIVTLERVEVPTD